jgi:hypothetical protein
MYGHGMVLDELKSVVDQVCGTDPQALADGESMVELHRCLARLEAATTRAVAAFDAGGQWSTDGARSGAAWLAGRCKLAADSARRRVRLGRGLRHLPVAEAGWLAGEVGEAQVAALVRARTPATQDALAGDEEMLVGEAKRLGFEAFTRVLAYWCQQADPDGVEADACRQREARRVHLSQSFGGMWFLDGLLDPISGAVVDNALRRIEQELFDADWAEARERLGDAATVADLGRTPAQRRADALVEMARRAGAVPQGARRPEPLFIVLVGYETFAGRMCELANGTVVSPGSLVGWLDEAWVERVVFDSPSRVIDVGVARRAFHRRHPPGGRGARPAVLPPAVHHPRRRVRGRPRRALERRRSHGGGQRAGGLWAPQPGPAPTTVAAAPGGAAAWPSLGIDGVSIPTRRFLPGSPDCASHLLTHRQVPTRFRRSVATWGANVRGGRRFRLLAWSVMTVTPAALVGPAPAGSAGAQERKSHTSSA